MLERGVLLPVKTAARGAKADVCTRNVAARRITPGETFPSRYAKINGGRYAAVRDFFYNFAHKLYK